MPPAGPALGILRSLTKVSLIAPLISVNSSPVTKRAMSMMWAPRSPCEPLPATFFWNRQIRGTSGPAQACRYWPRTW